MKKMIALTLALLTAMPLMAGCGGDEPAETTAATTKPAATEPLNDADALAATKARIEELSGSLTSNEAIEEMRQLVWDEYAYDIKINQADRADEIKKGKTTQIKLNGVTMKVMTNVTGKAPEGGYPLFLVYHGGGYDPSGQTNESQWSGMAGRYDDYPGIYCSIRSVSDNESSGQIFSTDISWQFYDRIIEDAIIFMNANPNKVYIVGYSAGGNGVYQIAPRITDRLASATMTAGHPENVDLSNLYNLPFFLNVGELDSAYSRNTVTVEYDQKLDALAEKYGGGYEHYTYVHAGKEHGVVGDNATSAQPVIKDIDAWLTAQKNGTAYTGGTVNENTHASSRMTEYTRDPIPTRVIWNSTVTRKSNEVRGLDTFYWISSNTQGGSLDISYNKETNTITVNSCSFRNADITVYLNEDMVDLFKPVTIIKSNGDEITFTPEISLDLLRSTTAERSDPNYQFCASYTFRDR